jgi:hypothetical protein
LSNLAVPFSWSTGMGKYVESRLSRHVVPDESSYAFWIWCGASANGSFCPTLYQMCLPATYSIGDSALILRFVTSRSRSRREHPGKRIFTTRCVQSIELGVLSVVPRKTSSVPTFCL